MRASRLVGIGIFALAGCSLFTSIDGVSGGDGPSTGQPDATTSDTSTPEGDADSSSVIDDDATDSNVTADTDAMPLPNLQPNGGFELVTANGCGSEWGVFQGNGTRTTTPRSGTYACKACGDHPTDKDYSLGNGSSTITTVQPGQRYRVEAWVRALDAAGEGQAVRATIRIYAPGSNTTIVQRIDPPTFPLTQTWTKVETILDILEAGDFDYYIQFNNGPLGSCALVDDVVVQRVF